ncbi:uncharacterized protein LOC123723024 [Papilio machaon]|uniref:uncharacterized protein LOC123723023 n=1 Tax=Papilio machaon TaxID=76193 RepID=UPI001E66340E|nr:uncharacterized protein LOC123723023 [Papilio machaon]XP_045541520.1 uncharacterized protein LOC123723024 [Papilio machaon]
MFGIRTPEKRADRAPSPDMDRPGTSKIVPADKSTPPGKEKGNLVKEAHKKLNIKLNINKETSDSSPKYRNRATEAKAWVSKAKVHLSQSRNIKTEIKNEVSLAIDILYKIIKELEGEIQGKGENEGGKKKEEKRPEPEIEKEREMDKIEKFGKILIEKMEKQAELLQQSNEKIIDLKQTLEEQKVAHKQNYTYANAVTQGVKIPQQKTLHSVVVTSKNETETGEEVLNRIRKVVNAKDGGVRVDKIRKAKDRKVIVGCETEEERNILKKRLKKAEEHLEVKDIKNKNPLVVLKDVFNYNTDEEILAALKNQNKDMMQDVEGIEEIEIAYKKRTRNLHTRHIVLRVPPQLWRKMTEVGRVRIDLQRVAAGTGCLDCQG